MFSTLLWLSLTIYHEARNQDYIDQLAVGHVILNRAKTSNRTVKEVVLRDKQFSCYNSGVQLPTDLDAFFTAVDVSFTVLSGKDFTQGSKYYHTKDVKPVWRKELTRIGSFGDHVFYKDRVKLKNTKRKRYITNDKQEYVVKHSTFDRRYVWQKVNSKN